MYMAYPTSPNQPKVRMRAVRLVYRGWSQRKVARHFGLSSGTVSKWIRKDKAMNNFGAHPIPTKSSRPKSHPKTLKPEVVQKIIEIRLAHHRCAEMVHQELLNSGFGASLKSVKRTLERNFLIRKRSPWKRWHFSLPRPEAIMPGDLVQIDTIHIMKNEKERFYVYTMIDLVTRWTYAWVSARANTHTSFKFVKLALRQALNFKMIQSDHGSEFSSWFTEQIGKLEIAHRHSRVRQSNDNSHVERFNRTIQEECLDKVTRRDPRAYQMAINKYLPYYNGRRLHLGIDLKTPLECFQAIV